MAVFPLLCLLLLPVQEPAQDPGRPVLRRGGPAKKTEPASEARPTAPPVKEVVVDEQGRAEQIVESKPAAGPTLLDRVREAAWNYSESLPNFICDQQVLRWYSKTFKPDWKLKDRVQVEVLYAGGKEDYRNVRVNGKPIKKGSPEDSGSWSTGEFGSVLLDILSERSQATFTPRGDSAAAGLNAKVLSYSILQPNSNWTVKFGYATKPAYKGAIWVDPDSARVLRIEMNTKQLPANYELDTVETTVDYGWVNISGTRYLLPVKSENLACVRGSFDCTRNEIEFRNYRKFQVESQVLQVESDITFPESDAPPPPAPKKKN